MELHHHRLSKAILLLSICVVFLSIPFMPKVAIDGHSYGLPSNRPAPNFFLDNPEGETISLADFRGKFVFLMFGYLNCQKICHSQALVFQEISQLADMKNELYFLYVAMDPERDTPNRLKHYFDQREENFISLRKNDFLVAQRLAMEYQAFFYVDGNMKTSYYGINHPGLYYLIGPDGNLRFTYTANQKATKMIVGDLLSLMQQ